MRRIRRRRMRIRRKRRRMRMRMSFFQERFGGLRGESRFQCEQVRQWWIDGCTEDLLASCMVSFLLTNLIPLKR